MFFCSIIRDLHLKKRKSFLELENVLKSFY